MNITQKPSPNFDSNRQPIDRIVILFFNKPSMPISFLITQPRFMKLVMSIYINKRKIFRTIVGFDVIYVMDFFNLRVNLATDLIFHNKYMNKLLSLIISHVAPRVNGVASLISSFIIAKKTDFRFVSRKMFFTDFTETSAFPVRVLRTLIASSIHITNYTISRKTMLSI